MSESRVMYQAGKLGNYHDVRYPDGKLAFRCDFERGLVQLQKRGEVYTFDLYELRRNVLGAAHVEQCQEEFA